MKYYKIIKDNCIIDVNNKWCRYQPKHGRVIVCDPQFAQLIQSSNGQTFYTTEWLKPLPDGVEFPIVQAVAIEQDEYAALKASLELNETISLPEAPETAAVEEMEAPVVNQETIMSASEMRQRILELEALVNKLLSK